MSNMAVRNGREAISLAWNAGDGFPLGVGWGKRVMWVFIVSDGLLFAGFLGSYGLARLTSSQWPDHLEVFRIGLITIMTFIMISSSATMAMAVRAAQDGIRKAIPFLLLTLAGGLIFLAMQSYEWMHFINDGGRLFANPWGAPLFSAYFFLITGFHGSHVLAGAVILAVSAMRCAAGRGSANGVELAGRYWHSVNLVWVSVFTLFYLA